MRSRSWFAPGWSLIPARAGTPGPAAWMTRWPGSGPSPPWRSRPWSRPVRKLMNQSSRFGRTQLYFELVQENISFAII